MRFAGGMLEHFIGAEMTRLSGVTFAYAHKGCGQDRCSTSLESGFCMAARAMLGGPRRRQKSPSCSACLLTCGKQYLLDVFKQEWNGRKAGVQQMEGTVHGDHAYGERALETSDYRRTPQRL